MKSSNLLNLLYEALSNSFLSSFFVLSCSTGNKTEQEGNTNIPISKAKEIPEDFEKYDLQGAVKSLKEVYQNTTKEVYFDQQGREVRISFTGKSDSTTYTISNEFDDRGKKILERKEFANGDIEKTTFKYKKRGLSEEKKFKNGALIKIVNHTKNKNQETIKIDQKGPDEKLIMESSFEYDESGNRIETHHKNEVTDSKYVSEFDENDNQIKSEIYSHGRLRYESNWEYNAKGHVVKYTLYGHDFGRIKVEERTYEYLYDSYGNWTERTEYRANETIITRREVSYF